MPAQIHRMQIQKLIAKFAILILACLLNHAAWAQDTTANVAIDFGDDSSPWAMDEECDDPRFTGPLTAIELNENDLGHDATDCQNLLAAGLVQIIRPPKELVHAINFGDNEGEWASDRECDDPRFDGEGLAEGLSNANLGHDAIDCRKLFLAGEVTYLGDDPAMDPVEFNGIMFGTNLSEWANDEECDDIRFEGEGMAPVFADTQQGLDASDCLTLYQNGQITLVGSALLVDASGIEFGWDFSDFRNDGECDDPRFEGAGMATTVVVDDMFADATDCRSLYVIGEITRAANPSPINFEEFFFGDDSSNFAQDEECDDPRFYGLGMAVDVDASGFATDATDCRSLLSENKIWLVGMAPSVTGLVQEGIDFGFDLATWSHDGECDDPRFEGSGAAGTARLSAVGQDATDCAAGFAAGTISLIDLETQLAETIAQIDFGDDTSSWALNEVCDDPRFSGPGAAAFMNPEDELHDATDCKSQFALGQVALVSVPQTEAADTPSQTSADPGAGDIELSGINFGDDSSQWSVDGECDDPRFRGAGMAEFLDDDDLERDATDCRELFAAGKITLAPGYETAAHPSGIDFGTDNSIWAFDGECDDVRFVGEKMGHDPLQANTMTDATDCRNAFDAGLISLAETNSEG